MFRKLFYTAVAAIIAAPVFATTTITGGPSLTITADPVDAALQTVDKGYAFFLILVTLGVAVMVWKFGRTAMAVVRRKFSGA